MASKGKGSSNFDFNRIISTIIEYIRNNTRYCVAAALLLVMVFVLAMCASAKDGGGDVSSTEAVSPAEEEFEVDSNEDITSLLTQYYTAYAAGDTDALSLIATPIAENEKTYIAMFSQYVEEYQDITCYTKNGLDSSSYMVYVSMKIKFTGVDTPAPGLEFFYVRTNDDGNLYIDNLYSPYNLANKENALDTSVSDLLQELINQDDAIALQEETQQSYEAAVASDEALATMVNVTIPGEISTWKDAVVASAAQTEATENTEAAESTEATEASGDETDAASSSEETESTDTTGTVYTLDKVNVRVSASTSADKLGTVASGTALKSTGTDGDWTQVEYSGYTGYVKTEFLTTTDPNAAGGDTAQSTDNTTSTDSSAATSNAEASNAIAAGTVIEITDAVNIRSEMSETSSKVGTAYGGDKVTVVQSYSEGWTKVTWNSKTGYIKTSLLQ